MAKRRYETSKRVQQGQLFPAAAKTTLEPPPEHIELLIEFLTAFQSIPQRYCMLCKAKTRLGIEAHKPGSLRRAFHLIKTLCAGLECRSHDLAEQFHVVPAHSVREIVKDSVVGQHHDFVTNLPFQTRLGCTRIPLGLYLSGQRGLWSIFRHQK
jgi:hypothetical protein